MAIPAAAMPQPARQMAEDGDPFIVFGSNTVVAINFQASEGVEAGDVTEVLIVDAEKPVLALLTPMPDPVPTETICFGIDPTMRPNIAALMQLAREWIADMVDHQVLAFYSAVEDTPEAANGQAPDGGPAIPKAATAKPKTKKMTTAVDHFGRADEPDLLCAGPVDQLDSSPTERTGGAQAADGRPTDSGAVAPKSSSRIVRFVVLCKNDGKPSEDSKKSPTSSSCCKASNDHSFSGRGRGGAANARRRNPGTSRSCAGQRTWSLNFQGEGTLSSMGKAGNPHCHWGQEELREERSCRWS